MALDLFVNNERFSNNSVFYRVKTSSPTTFSVKLVDSVDPNANLYSLYNVEYSINNGSYAMFVPDDNGFFEMPVTIDTGVAGTTSISVRVSADRVLTNAFQMSAIILDAFPSVDFIAYPSLYVNLSTGTAEQITSTNYHLSSRGIYFYGEGHTEVINLSSNFEYNTENVGCVANWYIGDLFTTPTAISSVQWPIIGSTVSKEFEVLSSINTSTELSAADLNFALSESRFLTNTINNVEDTGDRVIFTPNYGNQIATFVFTTTANETITQIKQLSSLEPVSWFDTVGTSNTPLTSILLNYALHHDVVKTSDGVLIDNVSYENQTLDFVYPIYENAVLKSNILTSTFSASASKMLEAFSLYGLRYLVTGRVKITKTLNPDLKLPLRLVDGIKTNYINGVLLSSNEITKQLRIEFYTDFSTTTNIRLLSTSTFSFLKSAQGVFETLNSQQNSYFHPSYATTLVTNLTLNPEYTAIRINEVVLNTLNPEQNNIQIQFPTTAVKNFTVNERTTITSNQGDRKTYPINIWLTNNKITTAGPIFYYDDITGDKKYYPFFASSVNSAGSDEGLTEKGLTLVNDPTYFANAAYGNRLKGSIQVLPYPKAIKSILENPFETSNILLPIEYIAKPFWTFTTTKDVYGDAFKERFAGTKWELQATSRAGDWSIQTRFLSAIPIYRFSLCYDQDTGNLILPTFKASAEYPTTITLTVTSYKDITLDVSPRDWQTKLASTVNMVTANIIPIPINKIYTPNYYYVRGQDVAFSIVSYPEEPFVINELKLSSKNSSEILILNKEAPTGTMKFDVVGVADILVEGKLINTSTNSVHELSFVYQDMLEIVKNLDDTVEEESFHTLTTPLNLSYPTQPKITPNEWVVVDIVNSIIEKFFINIQELISYSKLYYQKDKFYGYIAPAQKITSMIVPEQFKEENPPRLWEDFDCSRDNITDEFATWDNFLYGPTSTWEFQDCLQRVKIDPSCFQKYCVQWNWRWRKRGATEINIKWGETKSVEPFAKKWRYEPCTIAPININCERLKWNISTIDFNEFPIPSSLPVERCAVVDVEINNQTNQLVIAHKTQINLVNNDYFCTHVATNKMADKIIGFQNIIGVATNNEGKVAVLDNVIPRISIFEIDTNDFVPVVNWGKYGTLESNQGMKDPKDIYIDSENCIWIADYGNECIKKFNLAGKLLNTITHSTLEGNGPISLCLDSKLNIHCLTQSKVIVFDKNGEYLFEYIFVEEIKQVSKITASYNKEMIYITHRYGILKYFRTGEFAFHLAKDMICGDGYVFEGYNSITQDKFRNVYVTAGDKILKYADVQQVLEIKAPIRTDLLWKLEDILLHKEEYVQPWVYLKSFHRLWDNIELLRNSLFYTDDLECKKYNKPIYDKNDLIIGQNEIVSNAVINRVIEQLWTNFESLIKYFDPNCKN